VAASSFGSGLVLLIGALGERNLFGDQKRTTNVEPVWKPGNGNSYKQEERLIPIVQLAGDSVL
jgi:hypothetical protein